MKPETKDWRAKAIAAAAEALHGRLHGERPNDDAGQRCREQLAAVVIDALGIEPAGAHWRPKSGHHRVFTIEVVDDGLVRTPHE